jgi:hypothetical protein
MASKAKTIDHTGPGTAILPQFISFSTSYPELDDRRSETGLCRVVPKRAGRNASPFPFANRNAAFVSLYI